MLQQSYIHLYVGTYKLNMFLENTTKRFWTLLSMALPKNGPQSKQIKKSIQKIFNDYGLDIMIESNMKIVNYSDATFNLQNL